MIPPGAPAGGGHRQRVWGPRAHRILILGTTAILPGRGLYLPPTLGTKFLPPGARPPAIVCWSLPPPEGAAPPPPARQPAPLPAATRGAGGCAAHASLSDAPVPTKCGIRGTKGR